MGTKDAVIPGSEEDIDNSFADLESAWDAAEAELTEVEDTSTEGEGETTPPSPEGEGGEGEPPAGKGTEPVSTAKEGDETPPPAQEPAEKAPVSWRPEAREVWNNLPPAAKQEILKRERDFAMGIQANSEAAQWARSFNNVIQPFRPMFAANGQDDATGVRNVLQVAATLQMGSQAQKVKVVSDLINQYGVDLESLDSYLAQGQMPAGGAGDPRLEQMLNERLAPLQNMYQQLQMAQVNHQRQSVQRANQTVAQFAADTSNEFYHDVKMDMADLLDMAAARGVELTLKDAYDRACMMNPSIASIIQARRAAKEIPGKRAAASSVRGVPSSPAPTKSVDTTRSAIEAAWDSLEQN